MMRLAILRFSHEGNSFNPLVTGRAAFERAEWLRGETAREAFRGTRTELGAAVDFLDAHAERQGVFLRCAAAPPSGPVADAMIGAVIAEAAADLAGQRWDGVYVSLHGAMIGECRLTPDRELLQAVRDAVGAAVPLAASFDLHANMAPDIAQITDIAVGYKTYPHVDCYETAWKALALLSAAAAGDIRPVVAIAKAGAVLPSHNMRTDTGPMAEIEGLAAGLEKRHGLLDVTPFGGFAYGDSPCAGAGASVTADGDRAAASAAAETLARAIAVRRTAFAPRLAAPRAAIAQALAAPRNSLFAIVEPADNPMSGGIGDTPALFRALFEARPAEPCVFAFFCDPGLVARAGAVGEGAVLDAKFGGRLTDAYGPPVVARTRVERLTAGRFVNDGPMARGAKVELGPTAVLALADLPTVSIIVTSACISPNDHAYFRLHGIELGRTRLLCAKAKNHFRAAFAGDCTEIIDVDTPGPATADIAALPFRHVPRSMLPQPLNAADP